MAAAIKKLPAKKQKAPATKKVLHKAASIKAVKAKVVVKKKIANVTVAAKAKSRTTVKTKARVVVKAEAKPKAVKAPAKAVAQKPEKKAFTAKTSVAPKKGPVAVAPSADRFLGLKSMLIAKRDTLLKEAKQEIQKYVSGENRQLVDTAIDEADWAAVEISEDINLKRLSAQRQLLNDVEECLRKVNEGTYGICEDCGEEISGKRLRVIPTATLCIDCKEQREKMAILDQEADI